VDLERGVRIVELSTHRFYVAALFLPQISSRPESPHPLIVAFLRAALAFQSSKRKYEIKM
jgi:CTP synthase (UTP-ammonia lyase)